MKVTEINITPIKPRNGLVGFASCVLAESLYIGSIGIMSRPDGSYRLTYPTKKVGSRDINLYHPITQKLGQEIEQHIIAQYENVMKGINHAGHSRADA